MDADNYDSFVVVNDSTECLDDAFGCRTIEAARWFVHDDHRWRREELDADGNTALLPTRKSSIECISDNGVSVCKHVHVFEHLLNALHLILSAHIIAQSEHRVKHEAFADSRCTREHVIL